MRQTVLTLNASVAALKETFDRALACAERLPPSSQATEMLVLLQHMGRELGPLDPKAPLDAPRQPPDLHTAVENMIQKATNPERVPGSGKPSPLGGDESQTGREPLSG